MARHDRTVVTRQTVVRIAADWACAIDVINYMEVSSWVHKQKRIFVVSGHTGAGRVNIRDVDPIFRAIRTEIICTVKD